ncbi:hypothetical protein L7F22_014303 [Adiantum nelumboides]|nr:hypothetical protein [Adiantum nelumboides]
MEAQLVPVHILPELLLCCGAGVVGGFMFGVLHVTMESAWFLLLQGLEARGLISRLAPSIPITRVKATIEDFVSVSVAPMPLAAFMFAGRETYWKNCHMSLDVTGGLLFTWVLMVLHDVYFWFIHTNLHHCKRVYRVVHQLHHTTGGDITVFSTAYGEILDIAVSFTPFYSIVMLWLYWRGEWNPLHIMLAFWAVNNVDMMGHCGYKLPIWVYVPASLGVLLTPLAQRPIHHYIHHLDPRFNRSLYFTWCDRLSGTYRRSHPKCTT